MKKEIPTFESEDEEQEFWAEHDSTEYVDWSRAQRAAEDEAASDGRMTPPMLTSKTPPPRIPPPRIPVAPLAEILRELAEDREDRDPAAKKKPPS